MHLFIFLGLAALAVGCLNLETRAQIFQDGSGTYLERVEIKKNLLDFALSQGGFANYDELLADALQKALQELAGVQGVRLLDVHGEWADADTARVSVLYAFDSVEKWNAFAVASKKPKMTFAAAVEKPRKKKAPAVTVWTIGFETNTDGAPKKPETPAEGGAPKGADAVGANVGSFKIVLVGPAPARETSPLPKDSPIQAQLPTDGSAEFSGQLNAVIAKQTFEARFAGQPLTADQLAAAKAAAFVQPSPQYRQLQQVMAQRQEREAVRQAGDQAIADSTFAVNVAIAKGGKVRWQTTRAYFGPTVAFFAGREAMFDALLPEAAGNYKLEVNKVKAPDGRDGLAFVRTRHGELPLTLLEGVVAVKQDGADRVYTVQLPPLPPGGSPKTAAAIMGKVVLVVPDPVTGANGKITGANEVTLELTGENLADGPTLIVRTTPGK